MCEGIEHVLIALDANKRLVAAWAMRLSMPSLESLTNEPRMKFAQK
jgi:hypothetical protein